MAQYPPFTLSGVVPAGGTLRLGYQPRSSAPVRVTQVTAEMSNGVGAACSLRLNDHLISPLVPTGDAASGDPAVWLTPGDLLEVVWTGAPVGATGSMVAIYDLGGAS